METAVGAGALAVAFAALGLLATALFRLDNKMDTGFAQVQARIDGSTDRLRDELDARFSRLDSRMDQSFDRVEERLSAVEMTLARHLEWHQATQG